jgi:serine O-acetyltransferase
MNAIVLYRVGNWCYRRRIPVVPSLLYYLTVLVYNSVIPPSCEIGARSRFAYGAIGVVVHAKSRIGSRVLIGQNITIGGSFGSGVPVIGDDVWIGPGARIFGSISVGSNVVIGANAVVNRDVPSNCVVAGVPARVLRRIAPGELDALRGEWLTAPPVGCAAQGRCAQEPEPSTDPPAQGTST